MLKKLLNHRKENLSSKPILTTHQLHNDKELPAIFESNGVFCLLYLLSGAKIYVQEIKAKHQELKNNNLQKLNVFEEAQTNSLEEPALKYKKLQEFKAVLAQTEKGTEQVEQAAQSWVGFFERIAASVISCNLLEENPAEASKEEDLRELFFIIGDIIQKETAEAQQKQKTELFLRLYSKGLALYETKLISFFNMNRFQPTELEGHSISKLKNIISFSGINKNNLDKLILTNIEKYGHVAYLDQLVGSGDISTSEKENILETIKNCQLLYPEQQTQLENEILAGAKARKGELGQKIKTFIENQDRKALLEIFNHQINASITVSMTDFLEKLFNLSLINKAQQADLAKRISAENQFNANLKDFILNNLLKEKIINKESIKKFNEGIAKKKSKKIEAQTKNIILKVIGNKLDTATVKLLSTEISLGKDVGPTTINLVNENIITAEQLRQIKGLLAEKQTKYEYNYLLELLNLLMQEKDNLVDLHKALTAFINIHHLIITQNYLDIIAFLSKSNLKNFSKTTRELLIKKNKKYLPLIYGIFYDIFDEEFGPIENNLEISQRAPKKLHIKYLTENLQEKSLDTQELPAGNAIAN